MGVFAAPEMRTLEEILGGIGPVKVASYEKRSLGNYLDEEGLLDQVFSPVSYY